LGTGLSNDQNKSLHIYTYHIISFVFGAPSHALKFQDEVDNALKLGTMSAAQSKALKSLFSGTKKLSGLNVTDVKVSNGALTGVVKFLKFDWNLIAYSDGGAKSTFIAFGPKKIFKFKDILKKVPGIELFDVIKFDHQMLAFAVGDVEIESRKLPANVTAITNNFFEGAHYDLAIPQGLTNFGTFNLKNAKILDDAIKFLGGKSTNVYTQISLKGNVLDNLLEGSPPSPELDMRAALPTFRPSIGGKITLPANVQFSLFGVLKPKEVQLGYAGTTDFKIGKQVVNLELETAITQQRGELPEFTMTATTFKGEPWKKAFGVKWLSIEDYKMEFGQQGDAVKVGIGGKTSIGSKQFDVYALGAVSAKTVGFPIPERIELAVNDGPDKIGSIGIKDIASIYLEMAKAVSGQKSLKLPKQFPDISIAGTKKGEGPSIALALEASGDAGIDMSGALRVLGTNIATIDRAFIQADQGIEIRAKTAKLGVGPFKFPTADIELVLRADKEGREIPEPRLLLKTRGIELFGSKSQMNLTMRPTQFELEALQNYGSLFKFNFLATTGEPIASLEHLAEVDLRLNASLSSDPGKWLRTSGKKAVEKAFSAVRKDVDAATKDLKNAQKKVDKLDKDIAKMKAKVTKERQKPVNQIKSAEKEVAKLNGDIKSMGGKISGAKKRISSCNQSKRICVWGKPVKDGCKKKVFGKCVIPKLKWKCQKYKTVANLPARAVCQAKNVKPVAELAAFETAKGTLVASREVAEKTLEGLRKGLTNIPVELDPRVSGLIVAQESATAALTVAKGTVQGFGEFTKILTQGVNVVGKPDIFALKNSSIKGSVRGALKGKPVVLAMNFRMLGKNYGQRLAFSLTDMEFNAKQLEVLALGAATKTVIAAGRKAKIIPHSLLDKVDDIYNKKRHAVDAELSKAITANNVDTPESKVAKLGADIDKSNNERKTKRKKAKEKSSKLKRLARLAKRDSRLTRLYSAEKLRNVDIRSLGKCLDVSGGKINKDGGNVIIWKCHGKNNQKWSFTRRSEIKVTGGKCLDVKGGKRKAGTNIIIWKCHGGKNQQWSFDKKGRLRGIGGRCLGVKGAKNKNGSNVVLQNCKKAKDQVWIAGKVKVR
jgi:peptidoglycan hydrolase CwlO-like protein